MSHFNNAVRFILRCTTLTIALHAINANGQNNIADNVAASSSGSELNRVESIDAKRLSGGEILIKVGLKNAIAVPPEIFTIGTPPRIALTFFKTTNGMDKRTQDFVEGDLRSATVVQAADRTRLVFNLNQMLTYSAPVIEGNTLSQIEH